MKKKNPYWSSMRVLFSGRVDCVIAALIHSRAFSHTFRIDDADFADRRFYSG